MKTDNEIIAEFMGFEPIKSNHGTHDHPERMGTYGGTGLTFKYDTDWSWLMPVVEKIGNLWEASGGGHQVSINLKIHNLFRVTPIHSHIQQVHKNIVAFIKWYNENKKP